MPDDIDDGSLFSQGETVSDPTATLSAEDLKALDAMQDDRFTPAFVRPVQAAPTDRLASEVYLTRALEAVEPWHSNAPPAAVVKARKALDDAITADRDARRAYAELPARKRATERAIVAADRAGEELPDLPDWNREAVLLRGRHEPLVAAVKAAHAAYREAVSAALPEWRLAMLADLKAKRAAAAEALRASGVQTAVREFHRALEAAREVDAAIYPTDPAPSGPITPATADVLSKGRHAADHLAAYLGSQHPAVSGAFLEREDPLRPPLWAREAIATDGNASAWSQLMSLEISENFRHSQHTAKEAERFRPDVTGELRQRSNVTTSSDW